MASIDIRVGCHDGRIDRIDVRSRTPQPAPVLVGLAPAAVGAVLARLYAICGAAQRACAELALAAAEGRPLPPERHERLATAVIDEAVQEHLWRLWLDWPTLLALPARTPEFTRAYGAIRESTRGWPEALASEVRRDWLGLDGNLETFADLAAFDRWARAGDSPAARIFAALQAEPAARARSAPHPAGTPDTPIAATAAHAWIAALEDSGRALEALLATRVVALETMLGALAAERPSRIDLAAASPSIGRGLGSVGTARGWLEHDVQLADGHVATYAIRTPTDRHFAAEGPFVAALRGAHATDAEAARRAAALWVLAYDPCVSYAIDEVANA
jgi:hypothetical protein